MRPGTTVAFMRTMNRKLSCVVVAMMCVSAPAFAQAPPPVPHDQVVSANPFGLLAGWFNAEYERRLTPLMTWGVSGSMFDFDDFEYRSGSVLIRFYPQERALERFFLGLRGGVIHVGNDGVADPAEDDATFGSIGFELGYTWLLGQRERIGI